ncbi:hypothetical protein BGZ65_006282 [Modicella reniformis]|uniref:Pyridoxamine 5'-phosphate oxidase N-terminal domain-containing protein n=1 Tax=Modicella reniformis TaxID=1440133 RepID=A0A9P6IN54_9FUNG|nr:hypothetical protein BGZ65_006282 [Modicella reniformis]
MGKFYENISEDHAEWIRQQKLFFVATAPLDPQGTVNASPKGYDCFRIMGPNRVCYLDLTGSGIETQSHLQQNGRVTFLFMAFEGAPRILRLFGRGHVAQVDTLEYQTLYSKYFASPPSSESQSETSVAAAIASSSRPTPYEFENASQIRGIIVATIHKVGTSCGWGVPFYEFKGERPTLRSFWAKKTKSQLGQYWAMANTSSRDGLPGIRHEFMGPEWAPRPSKSSLLAKMTSQVASFLRGDFVLHSALLVAGFGTGLAASRFLA